MGSGPGLYVDALRAAGIDAEGIDPSGPLSAERHLYQTNILNQMAWLPQDGYDVVLCLEVAEHIPASDADRFIERLCQLAPTIYFSAAKPGQGGIGHVNCQEKDYWRERFAAHGFAEDEHMTTVWLDFMAQGPHMGWLTQNGMVFRRYGDLAYAGILSDELPQAARIADFFAGNPP